MIKERRAWYERGMETVHDDNNIKGFFEDYRWLSNFHLSNIEYEGVIYPSSENAYQAAKCVNPEDRHLFVLITPASAKKLGRSVRMRDDWDDVKIGIMKDILTQKFKNEDLRKKLNTTKGKYLEETNWWKDKYWGVCDGEGENVLGKILMQIRDDSR